MALRNSLRHRRRTALTLGLLAAGGAMFLAALNTAEAWKKEIAEVYLRRHYDVEIRLNRAEPLDVVLPLLGRIEGVRKVEAWGFAPAAFVRPGVADVVRTYPDGGHGSFVMLAPPPSTTLIDYPVIAGRWLEAQDTDAVVLNRLAIAQAPDVKVGSRIALSLGGRATTWRVAGIVEEIGSSAAAYVADASFARAAGIPGRAAMFRIVTTSRTPAARLAAIRSIERDLDAAGMSVAVAIPLAELRTAIGEHILVLISSLLAMAALMAVVGALGLTSTMSVSVVERTREFGVMHAIGAGPRQVRRIVMAEGVFIGALSWPAAAALGVLLSALVGREVGMLAFKVTLPLVMSPTALFGWLAIVVVLAAAATALPAWRASRLSVREALAHV
jgi:putative ABC transport system permease protein